MGASLRFADGLASNASPWILGIAGAQADSNAVRQTEHERSRKEADDLRETLGARWDAFQPLKAAFISAMDQAEIFLPESANLLLAELWNLYASINASQSTYLMTLRQGTHLEELYEGALGSRVQEKAKGLRGAIREELRPFAQLE